MDWKLPKWSFYQFVGPTTIHLQHEFYLLVTLTMLTISSMHTLYGESLGTLGDFQFLFVVSLWLARHLLLRWMCTWDTATTRSPTLQGLLVCWWTSHISAGQYFDRPNPQVVAKLVGSSHTDDGHTMATLSSFVSPSIMYAWHLFKVRIWFPSSAFQEKFWSALGGHYSIQSFDSRNSSSSSQLKLGINNAYSYWNKFWTLYGLSLHGIVPLAIMALYAWHFFGDVDIAPFALTRYTMNLEEDARELRPYGAYRKLEKPSLGHILIVLSLGSTLASIFLYGRIIFPFPDLVAASSVHKAVRNEGKSSASQPIVSVWVGCSMQVN